MEELLSLKWNNHRSTFIHILGVLRDKQLYTDATLACDGKFYNVHKMVMSTCSDYFSAIFDKTSCKNPVIVLKDIKSEDLEALLDYMYLGEVNVRQCDLASLIKSAECLRIKGLAVPDDEPPKKAIINRDSQVRKQELLGSPPSKRRRREDSDDGRDSVRPVNTNTYRHSSPIRPKTPLHQRASPSPHRTPLDSKIPASSPHSQDGSLGAHSDSKYKDSTDPGDGHPAVKQEIDDSANDDIPDTETYDLTNDDFKEENDDDGGGDLSNDLPEFLQSDHLQDSSFPHGSFPGTSAFQPGDIANWQGENSNLGFPSHLNFGSSEASSQQNAPGASEFMWSKYSAYLLDGRCRICGKQFFDSPSWKQKFTRHVMTHSGEKPYSCSYCYYRCSRKDVLKCHVSRVHNLK